MRSDVVWLEQPGSSRVARGAVPTVRRATQPPHRGLPGVRPFSATNDPSRAECAVDSDGTSCRPLTEDRKRVAQDDARAQVVMKRPREVEIERGRRRADRARASTTHAPSAADIASRSPTSPQAAQRVNAIGQRLGDACAAQAALRQRGGPRRCAHDAADDAGQSSRPQTPRDRSPRASRPGENAASERPHSRAHVGRGACPRRRAGSRARRRARGRPGARDRGGPARRWRHRRRAAARRAPIAVRERVLLIGLHRLAVGARDARSGRNHLHGRQPGRRAPACALLLPLGQLVLRGVRRHDATDRARAAVGARVALGARRAPCPGRCARRASRAGRARARATRP